MRTDIHAIDDLVKALCKGDPDERVPLELVTAMARAAIHAHWIECPHLEFTTERTIGNRNVTQCCQLCGARLVLEDNTDG